MGRRGGRRRGGERMLRGVNMLWRAGLHERSFGLLWTSYAGGTGHASNSGATVFILLCI